MLFCFNKMLCKIKRNRSQPDPQLTKTTSQKCGYAKVLTIGKSNPYKKKNINKNLMVELRNLTYISAVWKRSRWREMPSFVFLWTWWVSEFTFIITFNIRPDYADAWMKTIFHRKCEGTLRRTRSDQKFSNKKQSRSFKLIIYYC